MRPSHALALALSLALLAGCTSAPATTETASIAAPTLTDAFHPSVASGALELVPPTPLDDVVLAQPGYAEPNIAAGYDGTLYASNAGCWMWRSDDHGATWDQVADGKTISGCGDADMAVDANGTVYWLGLFGDDGLTIPFQASHDKGKTWTKPVDLAAGSGSDREWIDVTPDGRVYASWRGAPGGTPGSGPLGLGGSGGEPEISFNGSPDGGLTWTGMVKIGPDGDAGPIVHDPVSGTLAIAVADFADQAGMAAPIVHVYTSADQGLTWAGVDAATLPTPRPAEANGYATDFPVLAFDGNGTLYLTYSALITDVGGVAPPEEVSLYGIMLQTSTDLGQTWSEPQLLSDPTKDARFPWVAAGAPGRLAIVWYENVRGIPGEMLPDEWNAMLYESIDAGATGELVTLTDAPIHTGALCTSGTGCVGPADRSMLDFFEVALGLDGQPVVAFASSDLSVSVPFVARPAVKPTEVHFVTVTGTSLL